MIDLTNKMEQKRLISYIKKDIRLHDVEIEFNDEGALMCTKGCDTYKVPHELIVNCSMTKLSKVDANRIVDSINARSSLDNSWMMPPLTYERLNREVVYEEIGYKVRTTFYEDFSIAEHFGKDAILDTFKQCVNSWKNNYEYFTELVMILNWKCCHKYEKGDMELAQLYSDLYYKARDYALDNYKGKALDYFYYTTD